MLLLKDRAHHKQTCCRCYTIIAAIAPSPFCSGYSLLSCFHRQLSSLSRPFKHHSLEFCPFFYFGPLALEFSALHYLSLQISLKFVFIQKVLFVMCLHLVLSCLTRYAWISCLKWWVVVFWMVHDWISAPSICWINTLYMLILIIICNDINIIKLCRIYQQGLTCKSPRMICTCHQLDYLAL